MVPQQSLRGLNQVKLGVALKVMCVIFEDMEKKQ